MSNFFPAYTGRDVAFIDRVNAAQDAFDIERQQAEALKSKQLRAALPEVFAEPTWWTGVANSGTSSVFLGGASLLGMDVFDNSELYNIPLNFQTKQNPSREDVALYGTGMTSPFGRAGAFDWDENNGDNNLEGLMELTKNIPPEDRFFILDSDSWGEFQDKLTRYRLQDPNLDREVMLESGSASSLWASFAFDATVLAGLGVASEPLAWLGTGARLQAAGARLAATAAATGTARATQAAAVAGTTAEAATAVGRVAGAVQIARSVAQSPAVIGIAERVGRYAALGIVDQTVINAARFGFDDYYHREYDQIAIEYAAAAALGGIFGGLTSKRIADRALRAYADSAFSTLPITPVFAQTAPPAVLGKTSVRGAVPAASATISGAPLQGLLEELKRLRIPIPVFVKTLREMGVIEGRSLSAIPNTVEAVAEVNKILSWDRVIAGANDSGFRLTQNGKVADVGAATIATRAREIARAVSSGPEAGAAPIPRPQMAGEEDELVNRIINRLLQDMRDADYSARRLSEIPDDADTLAKIDAWFDDIEAGHNSPFGYRRNTQTNQASAPMTPNTPAPQGAGGATVQAGSSPAGTSAASGGPAVNALGTPSQNASASPVQQISSNLAGPTPVGKKQVNPLPGDISGAATPAEALERAVPINNTRLIGLSRTLNQAAELLRKDANPLLRLFAFRAFNSRRLLVDSVTGEAVPQPWTQAEEVKNLLDRTLAENIYLRKAYFYRYLLGKAGTDDLKFREVIGGFFSYGRRQANKEFEERVWRSVISGKADADDAINSYVKHLKDTFESVRVRARDAGIEGFEDFRQLANYLPRYYNWPRIQRLTATPEGRKALADLFAKALDDGTGQRTLRVWDGTAYKTYKFTDLDEAGKVFADRVSATASGYRDADYLNLDFEIVEAIEKMQGKLKEAKSSPTPRGRTRVLINEEAEIDAGIDLLGNGSTKLSIFDIVNSDSTNIVKKYATAVLGAVNEREILDTLADDLYALGFRKLDVGSSGTPSRLTFESFEDFAAQANNVGQVHFNGRSVSNEEAKSLERLVRDLSLRPRIDSEVYQGKLNPNRASELTAAGVSVMKAGTYLIYGGKFALSAVGEIGRPMYDFGTLQTIRNIPIAMDMMRTWAKMPTKARGLTQLLDHYGIATDRLRRVVYGTPEAEIQFSRTGKFRQRLAGISNAFSDITGLGPITSLTQFLSGSLVLQHLYEVGMGLTKKMDEATMKHLGLTDLDYDRAAAFIANNAVTKKRFGRSVIIDINNINHPDNDAVRVFMDRYVKSRIQDVPTAGDTSEIYDSALGSLFTQFRNYNIKAVDNLLLANISRIRNGNGWGGKAKAAKTVAGEIAASMLLAGLIKQSQGHAEAYEAHAIGDHKRAYEIEETLNLKGFFRRSLLGPAELWLPVAAIEGANGFVNDEPFLSQYRNSGSDILSFPALELTQKVGRATYDIGGAISSELFPGDDNDYKRWITRKTVHNIRTSLPFQNFAPVALFLNMAEKELNDFFDLPYEQPRQ